MSRRDRETATPPQTTGYQSTIQSNRRRLEAARAHLDALFAQAELPQIGGRKFWGAIRMEIAFRDGEAGDVLVSIEQRDRCVGGTL
jgi:hypothetical protein